MRDNRYSVVGYSDVAVTHTMEGRVFNHASKVAMGLENLRTNVPDVAVDPLAALATAIDLPFRTGVTKTIILIRLGKTFI